MFCIFSAILLFLNAYEGVSMNDCEIMLQELVLNCDLTIKELELNLVQFQFMSCGLFKQSENILSNNLNSVKQEKAMYEYLLKIKQQMPSVMSDMSLLDGLTTVH